MNGHHNDPDIVQMRHGLSAAKKQYREAIRNAERARRAKIVFTYQLQTAAEKGRPWEARFREVIEAEDIVEHGLPPNMIQDLFGEDALGRWDDVLQECLGILEAFDVVLLDRPRLLHILKCLMQILDGLGDEVEDEQDDRRRHLEDGFFLVASKIVERFRYEDWRQISQAEAYVLTDAMGRLELGEFLMKLFSDIILT